MSHKPLVSVIIIFLNEDRFLAEAIKSVLVQTYDQWELLLIDDGSTDNSSNIAQKYVQQYPERIRYITHAGRANLGMSISRAVGVESARGEYISYLDGDDKWSPKKLEKQVDLLEKHTDADITFGPLWVWYSWSDELSGNDFLYGVNPNGRHPFQDRIVSAPELVKLFLKDRDFIPSGFLAKRSIFAKTGVYQDDFVGPYSDAIALVQVCMMATAYVSEEVGYYYRKHRSSNTYQSSLAGKQNEERLMFLLWVKQYFESQLEVDSELHKLVDSEIFKCHHPRLNRLLDSKYLLNQIESKLIPLGRRVLPEAWRQWLWHNWVQWRSGNFSA